MSIRNILLVVLIVAGCSTAGYAAWRAWPTLQEYRQSSTVTEPTGYQFAVVGDNHGVSPIYEQILNDLDRVQPAFLLNVADTSEHGSVEELRAVQQLEAGHDFPVYHVIGNHELQTDPTGGIFRQVFGRPECTAIDIDQIRLVLLDNADRKTGFSDTCLDVARAALASAGQKKVFVAYHRPFGLPFDDLLGDDETPTSRQTNERLRAILRSTDQVAYIFNGHIHTYIPYSLEDIPAVVTGGGGDQAQAAIGGAKANYFHYLLVTVRDDSVSITVRPVQLHD